MRIQQLLIIPLLGFGLILTTILSLGQPATTLARSEFRSLGDEIVVTPDQSIQAAIDAANPRDTLIIQAGIYTESLTLSKAVSLTGVSSATTIIRALPAQRVLTVMGATVDNSVVISGLTFTGGDVTGGVTCRTYCGAGILVIQSAQPLIRNVNFTNNQAGGNGGGLYAEIGSPLSLINTAFISNTGSHGGGALLSDVVTITGGYFEHNVSGGDGGGLDVESRLTLSDTVFIGNTAANVGGGVFASNSIKVTGGRFEQNVAAHGSGLFTAGTLILSDSTFISNTAAGDGGGALALGVMTVSGGRFEDNVAGQNGGGFFTHSALTLTDTMLISNTATVTGGGGAVARGIALITGGHFGHNRCTGTNCQGGGLNAQSTLILSDTDFINNTAAHHGGGVLVLGKANVINSRFRDNVSNLGGGGLNAVNLSLSNSEFVGNVAAGLGGGVIAFGPTTVTGGRFEGNQANLGGGGLNVQNVLTLRKTEFISNTTAAFGGGAVVRGATTVIGGRFEKNIAGSQGGALIVTGTLSLTDTEFIGNRANVFGGGGVIGLGPIRVTNGYFKSNIAIGNGGGLNAQNALTLSSTVFISNTALDKGGGAIAFGMTTVNSGYFEKNAAGINGGGLAGANTLILSNTEFISNTADSGGGVDAIGTMTVINGRFKRNAAKFDGGGLNAQSSLTLSGTEFVSNTAGLTGGGANLLGPATVTRARFEGNMANEKNGIAGGLHAQDMLILSNSNFVNNSADLQGGGVVVDGTAVVTGSRFENNRCINLIFDCAGGGLLAFNNLTLNSARFIGNSAALGGALSLDGGDAQIVNSVFARNMASTGAGLRLNSSGKVNILHITIADANLNSGQAIAIEGSTVGVTNTLIANYNTGLMQMSGTVFEDYNLFFNTPNTKTGTVASGGHSLIDDPNFIDPVDANYHLGLGSAAIDRGVDAGITTDLEGNARPQGNGFDIGAYETAGGDLYLPLIFRDTP